MSALCNVYQIDHNEHMFKLFNHDGLVNLIELGKLSGHTAGFKSIDYPLLVVIVDKKIVSHSSVSELTELLSKPTRVHDDATDEEIIEQAKAMRISVTEGTCSECNVKWDPNGEINHTCGTCGAAESRASTPIAIESIVKTINAKLNISARAAKQDW